MRPAKLSMLLLLASLFSAGCATRLSRQPVTMAVAMPGAFATNEAAQPSDVEPAWWLDLEDAQLTALIEESLTANPSLTELVARVDAARAEARQAGAALWPSLDAGLTSSRRKQVFIGLPIPGNDAGVVSSTSTSHGLSLNVSWEANLWGRLGAAESAGLSEVIARGYDLDAGRLSVAGQVAKAYYGLVEARRQLSLATQTLANRKRAEARAQRRYESGLLGSLDVRFAQSERARSAALVSLRQQSERVTSRQLELLLGRFPAGLVETSLELPSPPQLPCPGIPAELLGRRPDLAAAEERVFAQRARLESARRSLYPRLSLSTSIGTASSQLSNLVDGDFSIWSLASNILGPILNGGRLRAGVDLAEAGVSGLEARFVSQALIAFGEVETLLAIETDLIARELALGDARDSASAALYQSEQRYASGVIDYLRLLESQRQSLQSESELLSLKRERLVTRIDLYLALGGGSTRVSQETAGGGA